MPAILNTSWSSLGALLIVVGALLLLGDALSGPAGITAVTFKGTLPEPRRRFVAAVAVAGAILVLAGSLILVIVAGVSVLAVAAAVLLAAVIVAIEMATLLHAHLTLLAQESQEQPQSWWWCLRHPLWRPARDC